MQGEWDMSQFLDFFYNFAKVKAVNSIFSVKVKEVDIFDKVISIAPDIKGKGGIASVLELYSESIRPFHYLPTNSTSGKLRGYFNAVVSLMRLPVERLRGRKIAHIHYAGGKSWLRKLFFLKYANLLGYKTIMHCHCEFNIFTKNIGADTAAKNLRKTNINIFLANSFKDFAETNLGLTNGAVVNNPVKTTDRKVTNKHNHPITFLFIGLLNKEKGCYDIIEAAKLLKDKGLPFYIVMAGIGKSETELKELVKRYELESEIHFPGWIKDKEKSSYLEQSDVLILPSYSEGMPVSILESKDYGLPVIASNVGAIPDIVQNGKNGFIIEPGDVESLANKMQIYIEDSELLQNHSQSSRNSVEYFKINRIVNDLKDIYTSLL